MSVAGAVSPSVGAVSPAAGAAAASAAAASTPLQEAAAKTASTALPAMPAATASSAPSISATASPPTAITIPAAAAAGARSALPAIAATFSGLAMLATALGQLSPTSSLPAVAAGVAGTVASAGSTQPPAPGGMPQNPPTIHPVIAVLTLVQAIPLGRVTEEMRQDRMPLAITLATVAFFTTFASRTGPTTLRRRFMPIASVSGTLLLYEIVKKLIFLIRKFFQ